MNRKKHYKPVPVYIPQNLDLKKMIENHMPGFNFHLDNFKYLVSQITEIPSFNKIAFESDYTPFYTPLIQRKVHDYRSYLDYLKKQNVIECDEVYFEGKSMGYRFTKWYQTKVKIEFIKDRTALMKQFYADLEQDRQSIEKYYYLSKWFNSKLKIDNDGAIKFLEERFRKGRSKGKEKDIKKYNCGFVSVYKIHNKIFPFKVDDNVERLHTILTNMCKDLRRFLTYDGKRLTAIDQKNSQPFYSCCLLEPEFYVRNQTETGKFNIYNITKKITTEVTQQQHKINKINNYIMLVKMSNYSSDTLEGFDRYKELTQDGTFYNVLKDECRLNYNVPLYDKKNTKKKFFFYMYSSNVSFPTEQNRYKYTFSKILPEINHVFDLYKQDQHSFFPRVMQSMESTLFIKRIAKRISEVCPDMPLFTVHDSIASYAGNEEYIAKVIIEEIQKATGFTPSVDFEKWC